MLNRMGVMSLLALMMFLPLGCTRTVEPQPMERGPARAAAPSQERDQAALHHGEPTKGPADTAGGYAPADHEPREPVAMEPVTHETETDETHGGPELEVAGVLFTIPDDWVAEQPVSSMRLAQYRLPGEAGPAELSAFSFGPGGGGGVDANIERWVGQMSSPDGDVQRDVRQETVNDLTIHIVTARGTYTPAAMGPMVPPADPLEGQGLYGLIVDGGPGGLVFMRVIGPLATVQAQQESLDAFSRGVRLAG